MMSSISTATQASTFPDINTSESCRPPASHSQDDYVEHALSELMKISRTANGVIDTSSSPKKTEQIVLEVSDKVAEVAIENFKNTSIYLYQHRQKKFTSETDVIVFMNDVAARINHGIVKEGVLFRKEDATNYTKLENLDSAYFHFAGEFFKRINSEKTDPAELASYVEWRVNLTDHFFVDGCGKISKALSNFVLFRANHQLTNTTSREKMLSFAPKKHYDPNKDDYCDENYLKWLEYYRSLFVATKK